MIEVGTYLVEMQFAVLEASSGVSQTGHNAGRPYVRGKLTRSDLPAPLPFIGPPPAEGPEGVKAGTVISLSGKVSEYQGNPQVTIDEMRVLEPHEVDENLFLPQGPHNPSTLMRAFDDLIDSVKDPDLARLLAALFADPEIKEQFTRAPAARGVHHAWIHGLVQHVLEMAIILDSICAVAPWNQVLSRDLLITGAIFHDLAKIDEYVLGPTIEMTDQGRWFGHIVLGLRHLDRLQEDVKLPQNLYLELRQMLASHHGKLEWGSPVMPVTANGWALHLADNVSAKMTTIWQAIDQAQRSGQTDGGWTDKVWALDGHPLYLGWLPGIYS